MAALRATLFDDLVSTFVDRNPGAIVVNLGEGLETQRYRLSGAACTWYTVDLPEAIAVRERFMPPDKLHRHIALSATDKGWMEHIPDNGPVLIVAQGLFMYFKEREVRRLLGDIATRFPQSEVVFDDVPRWVSRASVLSKGLPLTLHYRTPVMPWGVNRSTLPFKLKSWVRSPCDITLIDYPPFPRGLSRLASSIFPALPGAKHWAPMLVHMTLR